MGRAEPVSLFGKLVVDWQAFATSREGRAALSRWTTADTTFERFHDPEGLLRGLRAYAGLDARDELWRSLLRLARSDVDARRVALYALWPGLNLVAQLYGRRCDYEDTAATVLLAALERIADYPFHRRSSPPANIVRDAQHRLHVLRENEAKDFGIFGDFAPIEDALDVGHHPTVAAADERLDLVGVAVETKLVTPRGARLIVLRRVLDVATQDQAEAEGRAVPAIRKARERAERTLAAAATWVA